MPRPAPSSLLGLGLLPLLSTGLPGQDAGSKASSTDSRPAAKAPSAASETRPAQAPALSSSKDSSTASAAETTLRELQESGRSLTLPDGSRLHLLSRPGRRVAHWATWVRMGGKDEPIGAQGLAEACMRASLSGSQNRGTRNWPEEERALELADRRGFELAQALSRRDKAEQIQALGKAWEEARTKAREWADPTRIERDLAALPIQGPTVRSGADGTLLLASMPSRRIVDFASFMDQRRRLAVLRGFQDQLEHVRRGLARNLPGPYLTEARLQAIQTHPMRGSHGLPRFVSRREALEFYHRFQRPERTVTVIVGDFDAKRIAEQLRGIFTTPGDPTLRPPVLSPEPDQRGFRESGLELPGDPTIVFAWRLPPDANRSGVELLARLLGQGPSSLLGRRLIAETHLARSVGMISSYPGLEEPSLFVLRIVCAEWDRDLYEKLLEEGKGVVQRLETRGFDEREFTLARGSLMADRLALIGDESQLAARLARALGTRGRIDLVPPDRKQCEKLLAEILRRSRLTLIHTSTRSFDKKPQKTGVKEGEPMGQQGKEGGR